MNKKILAIFIIVALAVHESQATKGVDLSTSFNNFSCFKSNGISFVITRAWKSNGAFDSVSLTNIKNARSAGIPYVDVYMFPCRGQSATSQVNSLISSLGSANYGMIWLDVETNPSSGCGWPKNSGTANCNYVTELVNAVKSKGKTVGIYSSYYMWEDIMGAASSCPGLGSVPMWYSHYDNLASFSDFKKFGGWSKPAIKQYVGDTTLCGAGVDLNFY